MVLQTDVPEARMGLVSNFGLMHRSVRSAILLCPLVEVHFGNFFSVKLDRYLGAVARDYHVIPLADWFHRVPGGLHQIVNGSGVDKAGRLGVVDGDFDTVK